MVDAVVTAVVVVVLVVVIVGVCVSAVFLIVLLELFCLWLFGTVLTGDRARQWNVCLGLFSSLASKGHVLAPSWCFIVIGGGMC